MAWSLPPARPFAEIDSADAEVHRRELARVSRLAMRGHINSSIFVTLDPGVATTTIIDSRISAQTSCGLCPVTANAAAALATTWAICTNGQVVLHHANNGQTDRNFTMGITG